jgi:hypothetical protein
MWQLTVCAFAAIFFLLWRSRHKRGSLQIFECRFEITEPDLAREFCNVLQASRKSLKPGRMRITEVETRIRVCFTFESSVETAREVFAQIQRRNEILNPVLGILSDQAAAESLAEMIAFPERKKAEPQSPEAPLPDSKSA